MQFQGRYRPIRLQASSLRDEDFSGAPDEMMTCQVALQTKLFCLLAEVKWFKDKVGFSFH